jgi:hypothetical protein
MSCLFRLCLVNSVYFRIGLVMLGEIRLNHVRTGYYRICDV